MLRNRGDSSRSISKCVCFGIARILRNPAAIVFAPGSREFFTFEQQQRLRWKRKDSKRSRSTSVCCGIARIPRDPGPNRLCSGIARNPRDASASAFSAGSQKFLLFLHLWSVAGKTDHRCVPVPKNGLSVGGTPQTGSTNAFGASPGRGYPPVGQHQRILGETGSTNAFGDAYNKLLESLRALSLNSR